VPTNRLRMKVRGAIKRLIGGNEASHEARNTRLSVDLPELPGLLERFSIKSSGC
jgi:hypothetical protein